MTVIALEDTVRQEFEAKYNIKRETGNMKFKDFAQKYLENYSMINKPSWRKTDYLYINSVFIPYFGKYKLKDITPVMCEKFKKSRIDKGVQANSLNIELHYLKKIFKQAIKWKDADTNPMNDVEFLKVIPKEKKILTKEEENLLFKALEKEAPWLSPLVLFGLNTGLRRKEMLELSWENVSIQNATAYIPAQSRKKKDR